MSTSEKPKNNGNWPDVPEAVFLASQPIENADAFEAENDTFTPLERRCEWRQVNEVTWKLSSTVQFSDTPASHGQWAGYRSGRALAWVISVGSGHRSWVARCRDRSFGPTTIGKAKAAAIAMAADPGMGKRISDPIRRLHQLHLSLVEQPLLNVFWGEFAGEGA